MRGWQDQASNLYASVLRVAFIPARVRSEIIDFELSQNIGNLTHGAARRRRRIDCLGERMEFHATGGGRRLLRSASAELPATSPLSANGK